MSSAAVLPRLEVRNTSKTFGPSTVLAGVTFAVAPAEVHALVGQNGSGKSTLIKVLTGYHQPDAGAEIIVDGTALSFPLRWAHARQAGIAVVHQDLGLLDELSVAENICVGGYVQGRYTRVIKTQAQAEIAARVLARLQSGIDPLAAVSTLTAAQRAVVAIARGLRSQQPGTGLLVLDESTRALGRAERRRFHSMLRRVVDEGTSVLMVSHDLQEVMEVADKVTVFRDGRVAGGGLEVASLDQEDIARLMLGAANKEITPVRADAPETTPFMVTGLSGKVVRDLTFGVRPGEIVGITGLPGSGFEEIPGLLTGAQKGTGLLSGPDGFRADLSSYSIRRGIQDGVVMVPERRIRDGLSGDITITDNLALVRKTSRRHRWLRSAASDHAAARQAIEELDIRPPAPGRLISRLSGGNQQKVLMAKWLGAGPRLLVLHEPTQAVDIGARTDILRLAQNVAAQGVAVILVTIEPADLTALCDRIYVFTAPGQLVETTASTADEVFELIYADAALAQGERP